MPDLLTRGDCLREYLTGAGADGDPQGVVTASLGGYRSSTEVMSYGIRIVNALTSISIDFASGGCSTGAGTLKALDSEHVIWKDSLGNYGDALYLPGSGSQGIVEAAGNPSSFLRVTRTSPASIFGEATVILYPRRNNFFGLDPVTSDWALGGVSEYVASIITNESLNPVMGLKRWVSPLAPSTVCSSALGGSGSGTLGGIFTNWPATGWCMVTSAGGSQKEVVYYSSRTDAVLTVPAAGRGLLGTAAVAGALGDGLYAVPGIAFGFDPAGVQALGSSIQTVANVNAAPVGVTWYRNPFPSGVPSINLDPGRQAGFWLWRQIPAGAVATPFSLNRLGQSFSGY